MRIGHGFDVHKFGGKKPLMIGGVYLPYENGLLAHSDGDVTLHAVIDSLLGATGLGDIGGLFPETNHMLKGIDSRIILREVWKLVHDRGYKLGNLDVTIIAQKPRMSSYIPQMCIFLAADLQCHVGDVNIKATTSEQLGFIGRCEGIACESIVLLIKK